MNSNKQNNETVLWKDKEWSSIDSEPCRVFSFHTLGSIVDINDKVISMDRTTPYAFIELECKKLGNNITGNSSLENRWSIEELRILEMLWLSSSEKAILAALPERTWKAITHKAHDNGLKRMQRQAIPITRRHWGEEDDRKGKELYEAGTPAAAIASYLNRSYDAILQRARKKGWQHNISDRLTAKGSPSIVKQNPKVSNEMCSGTPCGGRPIIDSGYRWLYNDSGIGENGGKIKYSLSHS